MRSASMVPGLVRGKGRIIQPARLTSAPEGVTIRAMNPYYATGFLSALVFWVWPVFLYRSLEAHWSTVILLTALLFVGAGRLASEIHIRFIAPRNPPKGSVTLIGAACFAIVAAAALTRFAYDRYAQA